MKKHTRSLLSLLLVTLLIASLAVPVMATISGSDYCGSYKYTYSIQKKSTSGVASITTPNTPTNVTAKAVNNVKHPTTGSSTTISRTVTGYASATATAGNTMTVNGTSYTVTIKSTTAEFKVNSTVVISAGELTDA